MRALRSTHPLGGHSPRLLACLLVALVGLFTFGCTASFNDVAKKAILSANEAQAAAATTYQDASAKEATAAEACRQAMVAHSITPPAMSATGWPAAKKQCADLGTPIPFDPFALQKAAAPVNGLYDLVRETNTVRLAFEPNAATADPAPLRTLMLRLAALFVEIEADLTGAGVSVPSNVSAAAGTLRAAGGLK
jgi:hypothetical protein